jgi:hypothetical protein
VAARHAELASVLGRLDGDRLFAGSLLPGWSRLTICCHLRYGAIATRRITAATLQHRPAAFYPGGRASARPATLEPARGERGLDVVASLIEESVQLDELWRHRSERQWGLVADEPEGNADLGPVPLWHLALLRLTEVEVHGHDLDLGLSPWSDDFVSLTLPQRLRWLPSRRANHRPVHAIDGTWVLASTDGPVFTISARGRRVEVTATGSPPAGAETIAGSSRQLLAFILGRAPLSELRVEGDPGLAGAFNAAFPPP